MKAQRDKEGHWLRSREAWNSVHSTDRINADNSPKTSTLASHNPIFVETLEPHPPGRLRKLLTI